MTDAKPVDLEAVEQRYADLDVLERYEHPDVQAAIRELRAARAKLAEQAQSISVLEAVRDAAAAFDAAWRTGAIRLTYASVEQEQIVHALRAALERCK